MAFEQLKAKLQAQGLFDPAHKKPLPRYPGTIAIITSSAGAAVHDMLRILRKRYPSLAMVSLLSQCGSREWKLRRSCAAPSAM
ncbi:MAG: exodeoxyribonuclease VII large subunit [Oscillospiraceae bacterium]